MRRCSCRRGRALARSGERRRPGVRRAAAGLRAAEGVPVDGDKGRLLTVLAFAAPVERGAVVVERHRDSGRRRVLAQQQRLTQRRRAVRGPHRDSLAVGVPVRGVRAEWRQACRAGSAWSGLRRRRGGLRCCSPPPPAAPAAWIIPAPQARLTAGYPPRPPSGGRRPCSSTPVCWWAGEPRHPGRAGRGGERLNPDTQSRKILASARRPATDRVDVDETSSAPRLFEPSGVEPVPPRPRTCPPLLDLFVRAACPVAGGLV